MIPWAPCWCGQVAVMVFIYDATGLTKAECADHVNRRYATTIQEQLDRTSYLPEPHRTVRQRGLLAAYTEFCLDTDQRHPHRLEAP